MCEPVKRILKSSIPDKKESRPSSKLVLPLLYVIKNTLQTFPHTLRSSAEAWSRQTPSRQEGGDAGSIPAFRGRPKCHRSPAATTGRCCGIPSRLLCCGAGKRYETLDQSLGAGGTLQKMMGVNYNGLAKWNPPQALVLSSVDQPGSCRLAFFTQAAAELLFRTKQLQQQPKGGLIESTAAVAVLQNLCV